jgi:hypothetical protein
MRSNRAFILLLMLAAVGCGLGTEVGNGFKPRGGGAGSGSKAPESSTGTNNQNSTPGGTTSSASVPGSTAGDTAAQAGGGTAPAAAALPFDVNLLFTGCASPFGETLTVPWRLVTPDGLTTLDLASDGKGTYTVTENGRALQSYAVDATAQHAIKTASGAAALPNSYTCGQVSSQPDAPGTIYGVKLFDADGKSTEVSWEITPAADGGLPTLWEIDVTLAGGAPIILKGQAPKAP